MNKGKYYISQYRHLHYRHGGVGYTDMETILDRAGYQPLLFPEKTTGRPGQLTGRVSTLLRYLRSVGRGSTVVFIHPVYARMHRIFLRLLARRSVRIVCILADIDGVKDGNPALLARELNFLKLASAFIVHNETMKEWVSQRFPGKAVSVLRFFDFLAAPAVRPRYKSMELVFAGNLEKSGFLQHLATEGLRSLRFNLYGPGAGDYGTNSYYHGIYQPDVLPPLLEGSFGLVWDGDGIARPEGALGHYLSLISPHKLSLYILAGLPIITHSSAACASLVAEYGIGFAVDDLRLIPEKIIALPEESYQLMRSNMKRLADRIKSGANLLEALDVRT